MSAALSLTLTYPLIWYQNEVFRGFNGNFFKALSILALSEQALVAVIYKGYVPKCSRIAVDGMVESLTRSLFLEQTMSESHEKNSEA